MEKSPIFEKTYQDYLTQIADLDLKPIEDILGIQVVGDKAIIHFFGKAFTVSGSGIAGPEGKKPHLSTCVILCKYLLMCPPFEPRETNWVTFKDFKDAAPLINSFATTVTNPLSKMFSGRPSALESAGARLGGYPPADTFSYDVSVQFDALPRIPVLLLFNDQDEEFAAQCSILFQKRTEAYLDMECVAMVGMLLYNYLSQLAG
jgi:hypothetical protein